MLKSILWDLDGTLTNPRKGILRCFQFALESHGLPAPPEDELLWVIGPPIHKSFAHFAPNGDEALTWQLVAKYRERFSAIGLFENELYEGILQVLQGLAGKDHFLATSKPHVFAKQIMHHFKLAPYFREMYGSELNGERSDKSELIGYILEQQNIDPQEAVMIGDRKYDIAGAKARGLRSIGVAWGYGAKGELQEAGADEIAHSPTDLGKILRRL